MKTRLKTPKPAPFFVVALLLLSLVGCTKERPRGAVEGAQKSAQAEQAPAGAAVNNAAPTPQDSQARSEAEPEAGQRQGDEQGISAGPQPRPSPGPSALPSTVANSHRAFLIHIGPGRCFDEAFGHVMLAIQDQSTASETADTAANLNVYSAGIVGFESALAQANQNAAAAASLFFANQVKAPTVMERTRWSSPEGSDTSAGSTQRIPESVLRIYRGGRGARCLGVKRSIEVRSLGLNETQVVALEESLNQRVERDRVVSQQQTYHPYERNCTTELRDHLFSDGVLGSAARAALQGDQRTQSRFDIVTAELERASGVLTPLRNLDTDTGPLFVLTDNPMVRMGLTMMLGLPSVGFNSGAELQALVEGLRTGPRASSPLAQGAVRFFTHSGEVESTPLTREAQVFLPSQLLLALDEAGVQTVPVGNIDTE